MKQKLTPTQTELTKLITVVNADRNMITDTYLSITPVNERQDWLEALGDIEAYLFNYERNKKIIKAYEKYLASKSLERE